VASGDEAGMATHYMQAQTVSGASINWLASLGRRAVAVQEAGLDSIQNQRHARGDDVDPNPDYDASDEVEYGVNWFAWILRGVYPPPAYPPV
jgi:hypothetical protein